MIMTMLCIFLSLQIPLQSTVLRGDSIDHSMTIPSSIPLENAQASVNQALQHIDHTSFEHFYEGGFAPNSNGELRDLENEELLFIERLEKKYEETYAHALKNDVFKKDFDLYLKKFLAKKLTNKTFDNWYAQCAMGKAKHYALKTFCTVVVNFMCHYFVTVTKEFVQTLPEGITKNTFRCLYHHEMPFSYLDNQETYPRAFAQFVRQIEESSGIKANHSLSTYFGVLNDVSAPVDVVANIIDIAQAVASKELNFLYLANNNLQQVPSFNTPHLIELHLQCNKLVYVPNFNLPLLRFLSLANNRLTTLPTLEKLTSLRWLIIHENNFVHVPNFKHLPSNCYIGYLSDHELL